MPDLWQAEPDYIHSDVIVIYLMTMVTSFILVKTKGDGRSAIRIIIGCGCALIIFVYRPYTINNMC